jgi:D-amino-acid oxidase
MNRRLFLKNTGMATLAAGAVACTPNAIRIAEKQVNILHSSRYLPKLKISMDRIVKETVGLRPYRTMGPRIEKEALGSKTLVHNYGHGGSGWSLSWGSADLATELVASSGEKKIAVMGCGVIGLTTARTLQYRGYDVTIYTKEMAPDITSSKATGTWSPAHRLIKKENISPEFYAKFKRAHETSFRTYQNLLGLGDYVVWTDSYAVSDEPRMERDHDMDDSNDKYAFMKVLPTTVALKKKEHPFKADYVYRSTSMVFNIPSLLKLYTDDFLRFGGKVKIQEFKSLEDIDTLTEKCVVNCTGIGAKQITHDECLKPISGQLAFVIPQNYVNYRINTRGGYTINRKDGIVVGGTHKMDSWDTTPNKEDTEKMVMAIKKVADEMYT